MRKYMDRVVKTDQFAQYVDDIGLAANNATDLTRFIRAVFKFIRLEGLTLTIEKAILESDKTNFVAKLLHQKELRRKLGRFTFLLTNSNAPNQNKHYRAT